MAKGTFNFFELHAEKIVLGICGAFALAMLWMYIISSPNVIEFNGEKVGPRELDERILTAAQRMDEKRKRAEPPKIEVPSFREEVRSLQDKGILAAGGAGMPVEPTLRLAGAFGKEIKIEGLEEQAESGVVDLVTPLKPSIPKVRTGRSVAARTPTVLLAAESPQPNQPKDATKVESSEFPWVSVAVYFDKLAQAAEMEKARYASYRRKVYVAGVDMQRQEVQANGEYSEWQDVPRCKAALDLKIPDPLFDERSSTLTNKGDIERAYGQVRSMQQAILQPPFYNVEVGDIWDLPPLPGWEETEAEEPAATGEPKPPKERKPKPKDRPQPPVNPRMPPMPPSGGEGGGGGRPGRGGGVMGEGSSEFYQPQGVNTEGRAKAEAKKVMQNALKEAKMALMRDKDYGKAMDRANSVKNNPDATKAMQRQAEALIKDIEKKLSGKDKSSIITRLAGSGGGGPPLITHPERGSQVVAWAHDDTVEPGKTYRYRVRVNLWNRYVGQNRFVRDPSGARQALIHGAWSDPSEPVSVTPSTYFFLASERKDRSQASVEVYKWRNGSWVKNTFEVGVGDVIGGVKKTKLEEFDEKDRQLTEDVDFTTGAVVLDLRFDEVVDLRVPQSKTDFTYRPKPSLVMVYLEPADGQIKERILDADRSDPLRTKLEEEL